MSLDLAMENGTILGFMDGVIPLLRRLLSETVLRAAVDAVVRWGCPRWIRWVLRSYERMGEAVKECFKKLV